MVKTRVPGTGWGLKLKQPEMGEDGRSKMD